MSLVRLYNKHGVLVYRNALVYSSLSELPPIGTDRSIVKTIFAEKEDQLTQDGGLTELMRYKTKVETFYKTISSINSPEIEAIEQCFERDKYQDGV